MSDTAVQPKLFTEFERDLGAAVGVRWEDFITAVAIYVYTNEAAFEITVAGIADAFNTSPELVREAIDSNRWLWRSKAENPEDDRVESDGE